MPKRLLAAGPTVACFLAILASPVLAAAPEPFVLVADLEDDPAERDSLPGGYTAFAGWIWFAATDGRTGRELWRTDGVTAERMSDVCPGPCGADFEHLVPFGPELLLFFTDDRERSRLAAIDAAGELREIQEIARGSWGERPVVLDDRLVFSARRPETGFEPWISDATRQGTHLLADLCPGDCSTWPGDFFPYGGRVYFAADTPAAGREMWRTDGTEGGTELVFEINPGPGNSNPQALVELAGKLVFRASGDGIGVELRATDGESPELLRDLAPGLGSSWPTTMAKIHDGLLYFTTLFGPPFAWKTDGTAAGTVVAPELEAGGDPPLPRAGVVAGDHLLFQRFGPAGIDLMSLDLGTLASQVITAAVSGLEWGAAFGSEALFLRDAGASSRQLWATDGTSSRLLHTFASPQRVAAGFTDLGTRSVFSVIDDDGLEPWITDGTAAGTRQLGDLHPPLAASDPASTVRWNGGLYTIAGPARRIWRLDEGGTVTAVSAAGDGPFERLIATAGPLYAVGSQGELWAEEGAGLTLLDDGFTIGHAAAFDRLFFARFALGQQLWVSDGTASGTELVVDLNPNHGGCQILCPPPPVYPAAITELGGAAYFFAYQDGEFLSLWRSDGSEDGTVKVTGGPMQVSDSELERFGDQLAFVATEDGRSTLWASDGVQSRQVATFPEEIEALHHLTAFGSQLAFVATAEGERDQLWISDGSAAGTRRLADLAGASGGRWAAVDELVAAEDRLFLAAWTDTLGGELWVSDGTASGTVALDLLPGRASSGASVLASLGDRVAFAATSPGSGFEPWISDGTTSGTFAVGDLLPGPESSSPEGFLLDGESVVFTADDGDHGRELFAYSLQELGEPCGPFELCLQSGRFRATVTWTDYDQETGPGIPLPFTSENSGLFWFFDADNWEMMVKVLDGCGQSGHHWVFAAATTDVAYTLTVTDTSTGATATYQNPLGQASPAITDTMAFATCP